ncbi:uncharacterized protein LACBIDRAFT_317831 [Laccaria bicolor S238N-H82]|uniref:Predicted protein n=1 Tax=Laccaria bicolor (strain S238N-H82 / ATCC MYA-4686) TaxID=486041 RepID=B0D5C1_LACBS|nr:uncharacterized protein LACBIDRAFT_317831 [Laccaria bicolor S238N-H82]EDR09991.1 predicted protein [Laccaria bicolor S238N-H82]|eukprot:XP_001879376.1 predicted protein [Laccaria bicolor S238N-H82]
MFKACEDNAIALADLPKAVAELLREHGPSHVNVECLTSENVIKYLDLHPNRLGLHLSTVETDAAVEWLSAFWIWFNESSLKDELFPKLHKVYLLPCTAGLKTAERPVFQIDDEHLDLVQDLMMFGIPFLHSACAVPAQNVLAKCGLLKKINDIHALLENLSSCSYEALTLDETKAQRLLNHIASCLPASCSSNDRLSGEMQSTLRSLPVFCLVTTDGHNIKAQRTHIPIGSTVRGIVATSFRAILPRIAHTVYIDLSNDPREILPYLEPDQPEPMKHDQLLPLAAEHLAQQPQRLQATILKHIIDHQQSTKPSILEQLRQRSFVYTIDGTTYAPADVIDPSSSLVALFPESNDRLARRSNNVEKLIVEYLASLGLLQSSLTGVIIKDRIQYVSQHTAPPVAKALLKVLRSSNFNCQSVDFDPQARWLPTAQGLLNSSECRPRPTSEKESSLFDQVLHVLEDEITVSASLRLALGWDRPISFDILVKQLDRVLTKNMTGKVAPIIRELSKRTLTVNGLDALRKVISNRGWIPQSGDSNVLISTADAVISQPIEKAFYKISATLSDRKEVKDFLRMMGCSDEPSAGAIIKKLDALRGQSITEQTVSSSISLLKALPPNLDDEQHSKIFVPDINMVLQPVASVYFNDIGDRSILVSAGDGMFHAHPRMDESFCRDLKMGRLGLKFVHLQTPGEDMGEKPITTVSRTLGQYTKKQLLPEFIANAWTPKRPFSRYY